jgi:PAS domain S-box-containing protein
MAAKRNRGRSPKKAGPARPAPKGRGQPKAPTSARTEATPVPVANGPPGPALVDNGSEEHLSQVLSLLQAQTRFDFRGYQKQTLIDRIERRMALTTGQTLADYVAHLRSNPDEAKRLAGDLRAFGTRFVGDSDAFDVAKSQVFVPPVDVTEHNGAADALTRRLAAIVECSADAIFSKDLDGTIQTWNHGAERLYGYTPAEAIGRSVCMFVPADRAAELADFMTRLRAGETIEQVETERLSKDGRRVPVSLTLSPIRDGDGKVVAASAVVRDISDRKRAEQGLRESGSRAADDLASMIRLQQVSTQLVNAGEPTALLLEILDTAIATTVADMGNIQLMDPVSGTLKIVAHRGFEKPFLEFFNSDHEGRAACGTALQSRARVVVEDVTTSPVFVDTPALDVLLSAGVRAVQCTPLVSRSGRIVGMLSTHFRTPHRPGDQDLRVIDLLARQAADWIEGTRDEAALRESEQRFRLMANAAPVMIWMSGLDRRCTWFNQAWLDFVGRPMEMELGDGWAENVHVDDVGRCLNTYASAFEARQPFSMEYRIKRHDGEFRWVIDNGTPMFFGDRFAGYIGSCTDVTDLKKVQEKLQSSEENTRRLLELQEAVTANMGEGLYTVDTQGRVTSMNAAAERLFGWTSVELLGRQMHDAIHHHYPDGRPFPVEECKGFQILSERKGVTEYEDVFIRKDGTFFPVSYNSAPLISEGKLSGRVIVFRDVTRRKAAENALHLLTAELGSQVEELTTILDILPVGVLKAIHSVDISLRTGPSWK